MPCTLKATMSHGSWPLGNCRKSKARANGTQGRPGPPPTTPESARGASRHICSHVCPVVAMTWWHSACPCGGNARQNFSRICRTRAKNRIYSHQHLPRGLHCFYPRPLSKHDKRKALLGVRPARIQPATLSVEDSYLPPSTYQRSNMYALMTNVIRANRIPASPTKSRSIFEPAMCHYGERSCSGLC